MKEVFSYNVLKIEALSSEMITKDDRFLFHALLQARIKFLCPETGNWSSEFELQYTADDPSREEAYRSCIEKLFNGEFRVKRFLKSDQRTAITSLSRHIHHVDYEHLGEPYKTTFEEMLRKGTWSTNNLIIPLQLN